MSTATVEAIAAAMVVFLLAGAGVVAALAKLFAGIADVRKAVGTIMSTTDGVKAEVTPNHGSSLADKVASIAQRQTDQTEMLRSLGHQLGEIHDNSVMIHNDHAARLRELERRE